MFFFTTKELNVFVKLIPCLAGRKLLTHLAKQKRLRISLAKRSSIKNLEMFPLAAIRKYRLRLSTQKINDFIYARRASGAVKHK